MFAVKMNQLKFNIFKAGRNSEYTLPSTIHQFCFLWFQLPEFNHGPKIWNKQKKKIQK